MNSVQFDESIDAILEKKEQARHTLSDGQIFALRLRYPRLKLLLTIINTVPESLQEKIRVLEAVESFITDLSTLSHESHKQIQDYGNSEKLNDVWEKMGHVYTDNNGAFKEEYYIKILEYEHQLNTTLLRYNIINALPSQEDL